MGHSRGRSGDTPKSGTRAPYIGDAPRPDPPDPRRVRDDVRRALDEDVGDGDRTAGLVSPDAVARAVVLCREACIVSGRPWFDEVFAQLDPRISVAWAVRDGEHTGADRSLCTLKGPARALLTGERTALNFLQLLSGVATQTGRFVDAVAGSRARILDTRKTVPGLRAAQKYAVRCGGGHNHRMGLYDALLVKENHIAACGSLSAAVSRARRECGGIPLEVEVESLEQLHEALEAGVTRLLLDNFSLAMLQDAVDITRGRARLEASGNMDLEQVAAVAAAGVDDISIGALTKHVRAVDLSMRFGGMEASRTDGSGGAA